jgi:hypothetical protein
MSFLTFSRQAHEEAACAASFFLFQPMFFDQIKHVVDCIGVTKITIRLTKLYQAVFLLRRASVVDLLRAFASAMCFADHRNRIAIDKTLPLANSIQGFDRNGRWLV